MPGAFGLLDDVCHDRVPSDRLVEAHPMLDVHELHREGLLAPGTEARIQGGGRLRAIRAGEKIEIDDQQIRVGWHPALPLRVFICPSCGRDCYKLHRVDSVWRCRWCHSLTYSSRHRNRTIRGFGRAAWLRKRLRADPRPFTPLPPAPLHARKHLRIAREIRQLERALLNYAAHDVVEVLERRHAKS